MFQRTGWLGRSKQGGGAACGARFLTLSAVNPYREAPGEKVQGRSRAAERRWNPSATPQQTACWGGIEASALAGTPPHNENKNGCQGNVAFLGPRTWEMATRWANHTEGGTQVCSLHRRGPQRANFTEGAPQTCQLYRRGIPDVLITQRERHMC